MKRLSLTTTDALDYLAKAVAEKGVDYVYPEEEYGGCMNAVMDEQTQEWHPACIVGYAMNQAGMTANDIADYGLTEAGVDDLVGEGVVEFDSEQAYEAWHLAQRMQDAGFSWGQSLEAAQRVAAGELSDEVYLEYKAAAILAEQEILTEEEQEQLKQLTLF